MIEELELAFNNKSSLEISVGQSKYMKNLFPFLGIKKPLRSQLQRLVFSKYPIKSEKELFSTLLALWKKDGREFQYAACDLAEKYLQLCTEESIAIFEKMIRTKSWWDTVDKIASNLIGPVLVRCPQFFPLMDQWIEDENLWIRRAALLSQLKYKTTTNEAKFFEYCQKLMLEKEFFIQKAIGWALREYSKTCPKKVELFISKHLSQLSPLSIREGLKIINKN